MSDSRDPVSGGESKQLEDKKGSDESKSAEDVEIDYINNLPMDDFEHAIVGAVIQVYFSNPENPLPDPLRARLIQFVNDMLEQGVTRGDLLEMTAYFKAIPKKLRTLDDCLDYAYSGIL